MSAFAGKRDALARGGVGASDSCTGGQVTAGLAPTGSFPAGNVAQMCLTRASPFLERTLGLKRTT